MFAKYRYLVFCDGLFNYLEVLILYFIHPLTYGLCAKDYTIFSTTCTFFFFSPRFDFCIFNELLHVFIIIIIRVGTSGLKRTSKQGFITFTSSNKTMDYSNREIRVLEETSQLTGSALYYIVPLNSICQ